MSGPILFPVAGQPPPDGGQRSACDALGPDQQYLRALQPERAPGPAAHHPVPVLWRGGEDADLGGALQTVLQL